MKLAQSLYREAPWQWSPIAPEQAHTVRNFFLRSYNAPGLHRIRLEGGPMSGRLAAAVILDQPARLASKRCGGLISMGRCNGAQRPPPISRLPA